MWERHEIEAVTVLAEELHVGATAARLGVTPGRISQTIKKLERRIGAPLFLRTTRSVTITDIGAQLATELQRAVRITDAAVREATASARGVTGTLRVGYSTPWSHELLLTAVEEFQRARPDILVELHAVHLHDLFGPITSGVLDLQLSDLPVVEPDLSVGPVIFSIPRTLIVPTRHRLAQRESVSLEELAYEPLVAIDGPLPDYWMAQHFPRQTPSGKPIPRGPAVAYWPDVLTYVAAGKGVSFGSERTPLFYARPDISFVPLVDAPPIDHALVWRTESKTPAQQIFIDTVHRHAQLA
ncbi:MAG: LysR family transcriptional regulator [Corynebacteriales bacterium]|nr:LysR family transcriptional regulator [Mycobacteriales bacterium]